MAQFASSLSETQRLVTVALIGFVIGVALTAGGFVLQERSETAPALSDDMSGETTTGETAAEDSPTEVTVIRGSANDRVDVDDQQAGGIVRLTSVTLAEASWVAVHEEVNGVIGNALGATRLNLGTTRGDIELLRSTTPERLYRVRLYRDNGDDAFNPRTDFLVVGSNNIPIEDTFRTLPRTTTP